VRRAPLIERVKRIKQPARVKPRKQRRFER